MNDLSHLNDLANEHYYEADPERKASLRQRLWEGAYELLKHLNIECSVMDHDDLVQELTLRLAGAAAYTVTEMDPNTPNPYTAEFDGELHRQFEDWREKGFPHSSPIGTTVPARPGWIDTYNPGKDKGAGFVGYIAANAKLAAKNIYRDTRDGGFSRRTLEAKNQVLRYIDRDKLSLREAKAKVVVDMNLGMDLLASLDAALRSEDSARSLDFPINTEGTQRLEDVLPSELIDPAVHIDRTEIKVNLDTLPPRYSKILQGIMDGKDPFTEIDFGAPMSLSQKAVMVDASLKLLRSKLAPPDGTTAA